MEKQIILFDGVCNLCNASVQTIIKLDKNKIFHFASLQSKAGKELTKKYSLENYDSVCILKNERAYVKSNAAIQILISIGGFYKLIYVAYIMPRVVRDGLYDFIAENRYKWFGKKDSCMIPTQELKERFLE
jgi:predicted DCC family thiol-disulfide oxidoreductase YuxK